MSLRNCDEFIVTSKFIMNQWCQHKYINKFNVIYPPFNFEKYKAAMNPEMAPETNGVQKIGFVGRLSEEKGIHSLLRSMVIIRREMPDARLVIVGTGPLEDKLKVLVSQLQLNSHVEFTGFKENVFETLRQLDIFVLPSRIEGCPISVLEAMAIGLPVVATNIGGNPELVRDGETGLLIPYNNPDRLAQAVLDLLQDKEKANTMGLKGQEVAFAEFHPSKFVKRLEDLYYRLYSEKS
jgi:glycosyltransferase involved in cell wall biosynthesis